MIQNEVYTGDKIKLSSLWIMFLMYKIEISKLAIFEYIILSIHVHISL